MKVKLLFLILFFLSFSSKAQFVSLTDLRYLVHASISSCNDYLIRRGWELYLNNDTTESSFEGFSVTSWGHTINQSNKTALGWVYVHHSDSTLNRVKYPFTSNVIYRIYVNELIKMKAIKTIGNPKAGIIDIYFGKNYIYTIETVPKNTDEQTPSFFITVFDRKDYLEYWSNILRNKS